MAEWDDDWDDFDDSFDEDYEEDDEIYGSGGADGLDIPDLAAYISDVLNRGIFNALYRYGKLNPDELPSVERHVLSFDTVYDCGRREKISGFSRSLISSTIRKDTTYGTCFCLSLYESLTHYSGPLLFGRIDNVYLHCRRSYVFDGDCLCGNIRLFWDETKSPYPLPIENLASIDDNKECVYLVIGDMIEEILNECEKSGNNDIRDN